MDANTRDDIILLSIRPKFAKQIFSGKKLYEFRKPSIPSNLSYVVLKENGSDKILGGFKVADMITATIDDLWENFGKEISEKDRFYRYYEGWEEGVALKIDVPEQFHPSVSLERITDKDPHLSVPDQFNHVYLTTRSLSILSNYSDQIKGLLKNRTLDEWSSKNTGDDFESHSSNKIEIRDIHPCEEQEFRELVSSSMVPEEYGEIDGSFIDHILESHNKGEDPYGYFTKKKEVHSLLANGDLAGFTVTTWKRGHSVKFGPTVLKENYQGEGLGPKFRKKLDSELANQGIYKTYSTIPEHSPIAFKYLIKSGYEVEVHMRKQYSKDHGEIVFGKIIGDSSIAPEFTFDRDRVDELEYSIGSSHHEGFSNFIIERMRPWYKDIGEGFVTSIQEAEKRDLEKDLSRKGKKVYLGTAHDEIKCCIIASRKRGGSVKISPLLSSIHGPSLRKFIDYVENDIRNKLDVRKFYSHVPLADPRILNDFQQFGYQIEGIIKEPYKPGVDMAFVGKFSQ